MPPAILDTDTMQRPLITYVLVFSVLFGAGWLAGFTWQHRTLIGYLWYTASEQRYLIMAGEAGPVTYEVQHSDYSQLVQLSQQNDDILGVELIRFPDVAAVAFRSPDSPAIATVEKLAMVGRMERKHITTRSSLSCSAVKSVAYMATFDSSS